MIIAGLDIATTTGISVMQGDKLLHAEAYRPKGKESSAIFHGFRTHLRSLLVSFRVEHVAAEEPLRTDIKRKNPDGSESPMISMATAYRLHGLIAHAEEVCFSLNIPFIPVHQSTWRKAFLGNGRADKDMALAQCNLLGYGIKSKDAAESIGVCWWLAGHLKVARLNRPGELFSGEAA